LQNYLKLIRFEKPIGVWLLFLPCLFGMILAAGQSGETLISWWMAQNIILFLAGSFLMRSCGCIINDICDADFDKNVARTKGRPLASGAISKKNALIFLGFLLFLALLVLLQFNMPTIFLGFFSVILVAIYPLMKRITFYPQIFLGLVYNLGILFAFTAIMACITPAAIALYVAAIFWTIIYDTIYAYQDAEDDLKIGVKSTALKFGDEPQKVLYILIFINWLFFLTAGLVGNLQFAYYPMIILAAAHLCCQVKKCDFKDGASCLKTFKSNIWVGVIISIALFLG
jgi:4-hydroxybenzoate polyprenyltransferase